MNLSDRYLGIFTKAAALLDPKVLSKKELRSAVGIYKDCVFFKLYKLSWANSVADPVQSPSRIFFSIWIDDQATGQNKLCYNIHALKLRNLKGHKIESRKFATAFRAVFKKYEDGWPNVSTNYGPLTLMEGWQRIVDENIEQQVAALAAQFFFIDHVIDLLLEERKV